MKVAIVGFGETKDQAPFDDKSVEIWGLNDLYDSIPRWDRWFDIHDWETISDVKQNRSKTVRTEKYKEMTCPIYLMEKWEGIPNAVKYPLKEIQDKFCGGGKGYFTNQVSYMIAFALYEGADEIGLYGVDMLIDTEYSIQRPSVEYWLGIAAGMGKRVLIPSGSTLLKTKFIYAYDKVEHDQFVEMYKLRVENWEKEKERILGEIETGNRLVEQYIGAINATNILLKEWDNV